MREQSGDFNEAATLRRDCGVKREGSDRRHSRERPVKTGNGELVRG
jgi:hypothetical protein